MDLDYIRLIAVIFGAAGFWKLLEIIVKFRPDKRKLTAEVRHLHAQSKKNVVDSWAQWCQVLEKRVKELEAVGEENKELKKQIGNQGKINSDLEKKVVRLEAENNRLLNQLKGQS